MMLGSIPPSYLLLAGTKIVLLLVGHEGCLLRNLETLQRPKPLLLQLTATLTILRQCGGRIF